MRFLVSYFICSADERSIKVGQTIRYLYLIFINIIFFFSSVTTPLFAAITAEKTPNNVYREVLTIKQEVQVLQGITDSLKLIMHQGELIL